MKTTVLDRKHAKVVLSTITKTGKTSYVELCNNTGIRWYNTVKLIVTELITANIIDSNWDVINNIPQADFEIISESKYYNIIKTAFDTRGIVSLKSLVQPLNVVKAPEGLRTALNTLVLAGVLTRVQAKVGSPVFYNLNA